MAESDGALSRFHVRIEPQLGILPEDFEFLPVNRFFVLMMTAGPNEHRHCMLGLTRGGSNGGRIRLIR